MDSNLYRINNESCRLKHLKVPHLKGDYMNNFLYAMYAVILAALSIFTGEIVTFVMLGFILITLQNIHSTLKDILKAKSKD